MDEQWKNRKLNSRFFFALTLIIVIAFSAWASIAAAELTFSGSTVSGDGSIVIDGSGTVSIGTSSAAAIIIGKTSQTTTFPGNIAVVGACAGCFAPGGDLGGTALAQTVQKIQGQAVTSTTPLINQVLQYNGSLWVPATISTGTGASSINGVSTSSFTITSTPSQIIIATTASPGVFVWSFPTNLSFTNATASGNVMVQGSLVDGSGNKYVTSTAGGVASLNGLSGTLTATGTANEVAVAASGTQLVFSLPQNINTNSTPTFGGIVLTGNATGTSLQLSGALSGSSTLTIAGATNLQSALTQSGGVVSLASTTINGNATTTGNLTVQGALFDGSGNKYATSTGGTGTVSSGTTGQVAYYAATGTTVSGENTISGAQGGGMVLLEKHSANNSSELDFTSCLSSNYDQYEITTTNLTFAGSMSMGFQMSSNGGSSYDTGNNYDFRIGYSGNNAASGGSGGVGVSKIYWREIGTTLDANTSLNATWYLYGPNTTNLYKQMNGILSFANGGLFVFYITGDWKSTSTVNAFRLIPDSGTFTSGTIRCYGLAGQ